MSERDQRPGVAEESVVEPAADADPPSVVLAGQPSTEPTTSESADPSASERTTAEKVDAEPATDQPPPSGSDPPAPDSPDELAPGALTTGEPAPGDASAGEPPTNEWTTSESDTSETPPAELPTTDSSSTESSTAESSTAESAATEAATEEPAAETPADADPPTEFLDAPADAAQDAEEPTEPAELTDDELDSTLEALLLVVDSPVDEESLASATDTTVARVNAALLRLAANYTEHDRGLDLRNTGGGWRYYTRDRYAPYVEKLLLGGQRAKLTRAALETLAVIAYRQPVTRARVAAVRGVNCDGVIRTLLARGLVEETGTDLETGGFLYRTTELFLERLGLSSLEDLPPIAPLLPEVDSIDDV